MASVKVSPKFQVVIPKEIREKLRLRAGQKLDMYEFGGVIRMFVPRPITELRGMCPGLKWNEEDRDHTERF